MKATIPPAPSLVEVAEEFAHWRRTRTTPRTPDELQQKAVGLLAHYRVSEVMRALGLHHKGLKAWQRKWSGSMEGALARSQPVDFVPLPALRPTASESSLAPTSLALKLTYHRSDDRALSVEGELSDGQWRQVLSLLTEEAER